jgi:hypothetical protein
VRDPLPGAALLLRVRVCVPRTVALCTLTTARSVRASYPNGGICFCLAKLERLADEAQKCALEYGVGLVRARSPP